MADRAIAAVSGLTSHFLSHQILSFPQFLRSKVISSESIDLTCNNGYPVTPVLRSACVTQLNTDAELRLCLGCEVSATGCPEGTLGPALRCWESQQQLIQEHVLPW